MKKALVALAAIVMVAFGIGISNAEPGPNDNNDHGLCTAYFNGQKNGNSDQAGPFQSLEQAGNDYTDSDGVDNDNDGQTDEDGEHADLSAAENIYNFCSNTTTIGGSPDHGRFTCVAEGEDSSPECTDNEGPGNS